MLNTTEGPGHIADCLIIHQALHGENCRHVVFNIMSTGNDDLACVQHFHTIAYKCIAHHTDAVIGLAQAGKPAGFSVPGKAGGNGIVLIQD